MRIEDLDKLDVKNDKGRTVTKIGLIITLSLRILIRLKKCALIECLQSYLKLTKNELKPHFFEGGHVKKFDPNKLPDFEFKYRWPRCLAISSTPITLTPDRS